MIKRDTFHSRLSRNVEMSSPIIKDALSSEEEQHHWGNSIRKLFYNSNGVSLKIDEGSTNPIIFSLNDPHHDGLCVGTR